MIVLSGTLTDVTARIEIVGPGRRGRWIAANLKAELLQRQRATTGKALRFNRPVCGNDSALRQTVAAQNRAGGLQRGQTRIDADRQAAACAQRHVIAAHLKLAIRQHMAAALQIEQASRRQCDIAGQIRSAVGKEGIGQRRYANIGGGEIC
jgi:hypothetical protein